MSADTIIEGLSTTILGMGVVFLSLSALYFVLCQFERIFVRSGDPQDMPGSTHDRPKGVGVDRGKQDVSADSEVAAVISAVLSVQGSCGGRVKIRRVSHLDE